MLRRDSVAFPPETLILWISFRQLLSAGADFVQLLRLAQASWELQQIFFASLLKKKSLSVHGEVRSS